MVARPILRPPPPRAVSYKPAKPAETILLAVSKLDDTPSHVYFEWSEKGPAENALRFLFAGEGDVPPLTHEILRRAEPDAAKRPVVHVGG